MSAPNTCEPKKYYSLQIFNFDQKSYTIKFSIVLNKFEIFISNDTFLKLSYKLSFELVNFHKLNKFFKQFDSVEEIFDYIVGLENLEKSISIFTEDKFLKLKISLPFISKGNTYNSIEVLVPNVEVNQNDLILKLCENAEKIINLELKYNYLIKCLDRNEDDYNIYIQTRFNVLNKIKDINSKIITSEDFILPLMGVKNKLNKEIKEVKLLYRASRDGDSTQFHNKCNGVINTVTFVKAKNGRKFGGFASKSWHSSNQWISDDKAFLFSFYYYECYYYNSGSNWIYGSSSYGPLWGAGYDLYLASGCLSNNTSTTKQSSSYNYNGKTFTLSGENNFRAEDYETYELILQ